MSVFGKHTGTKLYDQLLPRNQDLIQQPFLSVLIPHAYPVSGADELNGGVPLKGCQWSLGLDHQMVLCLCNIYYWKGFAVSAPSSSSLLTQ